MRQLVFLVFSIILSALLSYIGSWWLVIIGPFLAAFILKSPAGEAFGLGFASIFLLWSIIGGIFLIKGHGDIATRMAMLLPMGGSRVLLISVTVLLGGLLGGLAALNAAQWRKILFRSTGLQIEGTE